MSYQALYRVWRPQTFDELIGQNVISQTLKNAVKYEQLGHAYLFTGPRGTGKTSAAKILAKAVNCPHSTDGNPCNECEICQNITEGRLSDVIEIDAASNNGVEEIRDLRDKVRYAPTQAKYKVYIIDEVHMLTTGAFNALLKTLEEPPGQVIFILATTEPHKIPDTIISRTQRFDFQRIQDQDIIERMQYILDADGVRYDEEALEIIARAAQGGMRDSLSLLDQALSYSRELVTVEAALEVSGSLDQQVLVEYIRHLYDGQTEDALQTFQRQVQKGKQGSRFVEELILFARDILLTTHTSKNYTLLSKDELKPLSGIEVSFYYDLIDQLNEAIVQMRLSNQPDLYVEVLTVRLAHRLYTNETSSGQVAEDASLITELRQQIEGLQHQLNQVNRNVPSSAQPTAERPTIQPINETTSLKEEPKASVQDNSTTEKKLVAPVRRRATMKPYELNVEEVFDVLNNAQAKHKKQLEHYWTQIISQLSPKLRRYFDKNTPPVAAGPGQVLISFQRENYASFIQHNEELKDLLVQSLSQIMNEAVKVYVIVEEDWRHIYKTYVEHFKKSGNKRPVAVPESLLEDYPAPTKQDTLEVTNPQSADSEQEEAPEVERDENIQSLDASIPPEHSAEEDELITKAIDLFGEDNVNIIR
ncbi:DNA polymerase III subunit gamma/tau [Dolosicoccus paucivorans]